MEAVIKLMPITRNVQCEFRFTGKGKAILKPCVCSVCEWLLRGLCLYLPHGPDLHFSTDCGNGGIQLHWNICIIEHCCAFFELFSLEYLCDAWS